MRSKAGQRRAAPLAPSAARGERRSPPRTIHPVRHSILRFTIVRFELTCMKRDEFDSIAEQSWTEARSASGPSRQRGRGAVPRPEQSTPSVVTSLTKCQRFELTCMNRDEFDSFAEQSWTEARSASGPEPQARDERRSPAANTTLRRKAGQRRAAPLVPSAARDVGRSPVPSNPPRQW